MVDTVNIVGSAGAYNGRLSPATAGVEVQATPISQPEISNAISPRMKADPFAGVIMQYLDTKGEVKAQTPSAAAVAYLKAGLTAEGTPRNEAGDVTA